MAETVLPWSRRTTARTLPDRRVEPWALLSLPLLAFLALPIAALLLRASPERVWSSFASPQIGPTILLSLKTSAVAAGLAVLLGIPVAYLLVHRRFPLSRLLESLLDLPIVLPPSVAGLALLLAFGRLGLVGAALETWGIRLAFTQAAVVLAQTFVAAPLFLRAAVIGFGQVEGELEQAAALDGANDWQRFRLVILPLSWRAILGGAAMTWARALGEFGATIIFAGNFPGRTQTMPLAIYLGFEIDLDLALTLSVILLLVSAFALVLIKALLGGELPERKS